MPYHPSIEAALESPEDDLRKPIITVAMPGANALRKKP